MSKDTSSKSFESNFKKLETLSSELQNNTISIDDLIPRMKEALGAVKACKEVLAATKSQLNEISKEFAEIESSSETKEN
jgi:exodeoxyribonuclease VII small subunit